MPNTSATGGYLSPSGSSLSDQPLQDFFHDWIAGISGLLNTLVRPRWVSEPSNIPEFGVTWLAFGIINKEWLEQPTIFHYSSSVEFPNGYDQLRRHRELEIKVTVYGPNSDSVENTLTNGIYIAQNRESLQLNNMDVISVTGSVTVPELVKEQWIYSTTFSIFIRAQLVYNYAVENILSVNGQLETDEYQTQLTTVGLGQTIPPPVPVPTR